MQKNKNKTNKQKNKQKNTTNELLNNFVFHSKKKMFYIWTTIKM